LNLTEIDNVIFQAAAETTVQRVTLSGGEPFLQVPKVKHVAATVASCRLKFRVVTNATFATTDEVAEKVLVELKEIGLESLAISWDSFHEKFISPKNVRTLLRAARKLEISVRITVVATASHRIGDAVGSLGQESFEIPVTEVRCLPVGRAESKVPKEELLPIPPWDKGRACLSDFDTLSVTADGSVYPCCAVGGFTQGILLGNVKDAPLRDLLRRRDNDMRWIILARKGPRHLLGFANDAELREINVTDADHDCVACNRMFRSQTGEILVERATSALRSQAKQFVGTINLESSESRDAKPVKGE
jgi:MoaA/NifB/PqqE/SkfB family radical SAM enzyme